MNTLSGLLKISVSRLRNKHYGAPGSEKIIVVSLFTHDTYYTMSNTWIKKVLEWFGLLYKKKLPILMKMTLYYKVDFKTLRMSVVTQAEPSQKLETEK